MIRGQLNRSFNNKKGQIVLGVALVVYNKTAVEITFSWFMTDKAFILLW